MLGRWGWKALAKVAGVAAGAYGVTLATVWANQERLLFKPDPFSRIGQSLRAMRGARAQGRRVREWVYRAPDGISIQGFLSLPAKHALGSDPLASAIYLGGIREESSWSLEHANAFAGMAFVCMNYRGYGLSEGKPEQDKILQDCSNAVRMLIEQGHISEDGIHLIGRSLGSGVAGYLCSKFSVRKVCLVTPYDSVMSVAKKKYWFLPVGMMFRHPFDAIPWAKQNSSEMLMLLSEVDQTVPHEHSWRLYRAWGGPKSQAVLAGTDHGNIVRHAGFFGRISSFFVQGQQARAHEIQAASEGFGLVEERPLGSRAPGGAQE